MLMWLEQSHGVISHSAHNTARQEQCVWDTAPAWAWAHPLPPGHTASTSFLQKSYGEVLLNLMLRDRRKVTVPLSHVPAFPSALPPTPFMLRLSAPGFVQSLVMQRSRGAWGLTDDNSSTSIQGPAFSDTVIQYSLVRFNGNWHSKSDILLLTTSLMMKIKLMKIQTANKLTSTLLKGLKSANAVLAGASPRLGTQGSRRDDQVLQHSAVTFVQGISINMKSINYLKRITKLYFWSFLPITPCWSDSMGWDPLELIQAWGCWDMFVPFSHHFKYQTSNISKHRRSKIRKLK